jgi:3-hydroxyisobutyrate dehydrogenase-like beta-hydroxyacid dehydrogenase
VSKIAFLGLGLMGTPMATRLLETGHDVTVWNRTPEKTKPLTERGAVAASSPAEAGARAEVAITMVANPEALDGVLFADAGLAGALGLGQVLIDMSTVGPDAIRSVAERLPQGVAFVDAPVRGSVPEAAEGALVIFVGANEETYEQVRPILEALGTLHHVGGLGAGAAMKLVVNATLGAAIAAFGEALALGEALGLDRTSLLDVLEESPIGVTVRGKRANVESGTYPPNFKLSLALKDLGLVTEAAGRRGRELKVEPASLAWLEEAAKAGSGDLDYSAVVAEIIGERPRA